MKKMLTVFFILFLLATPPLVAEFYNLSPNMNLPIPQVGVEPGPQYATDINNALTILDGHNHTPGSGVQVPVSGLNMNGDLPFNGNNATLLRSTRYSPQSAFSVAADNDSVSVNGVDLYYRDGNGNNVRLTQSGAVAGTPGSIGSLASPASATYSAGSSTFIWQSAANTSAIMDFQSMILRNTAANSKGLSVLPPAAMGSNITETLPTIPGSTSFMQMDASGIMSATVAVSAGLTGSNIANNVNLGGKTVQETAKNVVVSNTNASTNSLAIVRGGGTTGGSTITGGEGYSFSSSGTGQQTLNLTTAFSDTPICTCSTNNLSTCGVIGASTTQVAFETGSSGTPATQSYTFICIGQRQ